MNIIFKFFILERKNKSLVFDRCWQVEAGNSFWPLTINSVVKLGGQQQY
jgi:hypothetical protein